ncbi:hypothetical protein ACJX0J_022058 [Zea mays]
MTSKHYDLMNIQMYFLLKSLELIQDLIFKCYLLLMKIDLYVFPFSFGFKKLRLCDVILFAFVFLISCIIYHKVLPLVFDSLPVVLSNPIKKCLILHLVF